MADLVLSNDSGAVVFKTPRTSRLNVANHLGIPDHELTSYTGTVWTRGIPDGSYRVSMYGYRRQAQTSIMTCLQRGLSFGVRSGKAHLVPRILSPE